MDKKIIIMCFLDHMYVNEILKHEWLSMKPTYVHEKLQIWLSLKESKPSNIAPRR
jgi:hypothetical protein